MEGLASEAASFLFYHFPSVKASPEGRPDSKSRERYTVNMRKLRLRKVKQPTE